LLQSREARLGSGATCPFRDRIRIESEEVHLPRL
jgi:hypothetical protein